MNISKALARAVSKVTAGLRPHRASIAMAFGAGAAIAGTVMACKATLDMSDIFEEHKKAMEEIRNSNPEVVDIPKETTKQYAYTIGKVVIGYLPAIGIAAAGYGLMTWSHVELKKMNAGLAVAVTSLENELRRTKKIVRDEVGDEVADRIFNGGHIEKYTIYEDEGDGKKPKKKEVDKVVYDGKPMDPYAVLFDESNKNWEKANLCNYRFVMNQLSYAQDKLDARGWLTLNEMLDLLDFDPVADGFVRGWNKYDENGDRTIIDLGLNTARARDFRNGTNRNIWLTFNIDPKPLGINMSKRANPRLS